MRIARGILSTLLTAVLAASIFTLYELCILTIITGGNLVEPFVQVAVFNIVVNSAIAILMAAAYVPAGKLLKMKKPYAGLFMLLSAINATALSSYIANIFLSTSIFELTGFFAGVGMLVFFTLAGIIAYRAASRSGAPSGGGRKAAAVLVAGTVILAGLALMGGGNKTPEKPAAADQPARPNIVFILIDALRMERLHAYGNPRETSPFIDSMLEDSASFDRAFAQSSWTKPSVASLFTGLYPHQHTAVNSRSGLPMEIWTYIEVFSEAGYDTCGFSANLHVTETAFMDQGFDHFETLRFGGVLANSSYSYILLSARRKFTDFFRIPIMEEFDFSADAETVFGRAVPWIDERRDRPFFAYIHLIDVHDPYRPQPGYAGLYTEDDGLPDDYHELDEMLKEYTLPGTRFLDPEKNLAPDDPIIRKFEAMYDEQILYTDHQINKFVDHLKERGLYDKSIILVTADHGEDFGDHGHFRHAGTLYNSLIHVPLIIRFPGGEHAGVISEPVALFDVLPTLAEFTGVDLPRDRPAVSRLPLITGGGDAVRPPIFSHLLANSTASGQNELVEAVIESGVKLIRTETPATGSTVNELFDMETDFTELQNLYGNDSEVSGSLDSRLKMIESLKYDARSVDANYSEETIDQLKQMGYIK